MTAATEVFVKEKLPYLFTTRGTRTIGTADRLDCNNNYNLGPTAFVDFTPFLTLLRRLAGPSFSFS